MNRDGVIDVPRNPAILERFIVRVLLLTTDAFGGHGGIALYNRDLSKALALMPEVDEVVVIPRNMPLPPEPIPEKVTFLQTAVGGKWRYVLASAQACRGRFDLVICGHINLLSLATALKAYLRAPLVLMVYGIDVWKQPSTLATQWLRRVDVVWSISAITRDRMQAWSKLPDDTFSLLPNAIHLDRYGVREKRRDLMERFGLTDAGQIIMTLARLSGAERYKGVDEVLEMIPALLQTVPGLKYVVAGDGDDRPRLALKAQSLGIADHVVFTGMVDETDKADIFRLADAFVMPGRGEGFGFVFLEALACGVPVVGSRLDGSREALRGGLLGELVDPTDGEAIRQGILRALAKPKCIPEDLDYFAWPAFAARTADGVRSLLGPARAGCGDSSRDKTA